MPTPDEGPSPFAPTLSSAIQVRPGDDLAGAIAHAPAGAVIELLAGDHVVTRPLVLTRPLTLLGAGLVATSVECGAGGAVLRVVGADVRIEGITFAYARPPGAHWPWQHWSDVLVVERGQLELADCLCERAHGQRWLPFFPYLELLPLRGGRAVWVGKGGKLKARGCQFLNNSVFGVATDQPEGLDLEDCQLAANEDSGVATWGDGGGRLAGCTLERNSFHGVVHKGRGELTCSDSTLRDNGLDGLRFGETSTGEARANRCERNAAAGIRVETRAAPHLFANVVRSNKQGLTFHDRAAGTAEGNTVELNTQAGIALYDRAAPELVRNLISQNGGPGLVYDGRAAGIARRNVLVDNAEPGLVMPRGCRADVDAFTRGVGSHLEEAFEALRALVGPHVAPAELAAALAAIWPHAPRGDELRAWLEEGLTPPEA